MGLVSRMLTAGGRWAPSGSPTFRSASRSRGPLGTTATFSGTVTAIEDGLATIEVQGTGENGERILSGVGHVRV